MIIDLPSTSTAAVSKRLVKVRNEVGAMALGRVLTLVIVVDEEHAENALVAANDASRQHPCRIVAVVLGNRRGRARLDAQIRVGGDAGASEIVVLRLYGPLTGHGRSVVTPLLLPDSPVVVWWPKDAPKNPAADPIGEIGQRRITDSAESSDPSRTLRRRAKYYTGGDTDLAWTRVTLWRGLLAAALDQPPYEPVTAVTVTGGTDSPSTDLLAGWLAATLECPATRARARAGAGLVSVRLERKSGNIDLVRPDGETATLSQPRQPNRRISLARRELADCLADELRRLDPDEVYARALITGVPDVSSRTMTQASAVASGEAPSPAEAAKAADRVAAATEHTSSAQLDRQPPPSGGSDPETVKQAAADRLSSETGEGARDPGTSGTGEGAGSPASSAPAGASEPSTSGAARRSRSRS